MKISHCSSKIVEQKYLTKPDRTGILWKELKRLKERERRSQEEL